MKNITKIRIVSFISIVAFIASNIVFSTKAENIFNNKNKSLKILSKKQSIEIENQQTVSDLMAYQIFSKAMANSKARELLEEIGFSLETEKQDVEQIVNRSRTINDRLNYYDEKIKLLKSQTNLTNEQLLEEILMIKNEKEQKISKEIYDYLKNNLTQNSWEKLDNYIKNDAKKNIQVISKTNLEYVGTANSLLTDTNVYTYAIGWNTKSEVYATGVVYDSSSDSSYRIAITSVSPNGKKVNSSSDWEINNVSYSSGMRAKEERGKYEFSVKVEQSSIRHNDVQYPLSNNIMEISNISLTVMTAPIIDLESISPTSSDLGSGESATVTANVSSSNDVPPGTIVTVEIFEISSPQFSYDVDPATRTKQVTISNPGTVKTVSFFLTINSTGATGSNTSVQNRIRIQSVQVPPGQPSVMVGSL